MMGRYFRLGAIHGCGFTAVVALVCVGTVARAQPRPASQAANPPASNPQASPTVKAGQVATDAPNAANGNSPALETVVVTARKRRESAQRTPIAITTLKAETLANAGVTDLTRLYAAVPGVKLDASLGEPVVYLRGVGPQAAFPNYGVPVPFLVDGHDVQMEALGAGLFDVQQLEVLRGPQGTLYGRDAIGGVVNVSTNKPVQKLEASGEFEIGNYGENREFLEANVPIGDTFAVRAAYQREYRDGYLSSNSGYVGNEAGRIEALYKPTPNFDALITASFSHQNSNTANWVPRGCGVVLPAGLTQSPNCGNTPHKYGLINSNNPWYDPSTDAGTYLHENGLSIAGTLNYYFDDGPTLTFLGQDAHSSLHDVSNVAYNRVANEQYDSSNSEELRLSDDRGHGAGELKWLVGLYRFQSDTPYFAQVFPATSQPAYYPVVQPGSSFFPGIPTAYVSVREPVIFQSSYAGYGQATYAVRNWLRLTGGGRYSVDEERGQEGDAAVGAPFFPPYVLNSHDYKHNQFNFKVGVDADVAKSSIVYANIETGYLQGGFDLSPKPTFPSETMTEYSVGSKNRFLNNQLELNAEAFYYDYKNYQLSYNDPNSGAQEIFSAPKVSIYGLELSGQYALTSYDRFSATFNYLNARIDKFVTPFTTTQDAASSVVLIPGGTNLKGYSLIDAPKVAISAGYSHDWLFNTGASLTAQIDTRYETSHYGEFQHSPEVTSPAFTKTDINVTYTAPNKRWHVNAYVRNIENSVEFGPGLVLAGAYIYPPRTYGARIGFDF
jgi:iron complex outermembrane receptor protein